MNRRQRRAFKRQWDSQIEQERNGAPPPPEIAAGMTKPRERLMFQVIADWINEDGTKQLMPVFPAVDQKDCADMFCRSIEEQIGLGKCRVMRNPRVVPLVPIQGV